MHMRMTLHIDDKILQEASRLTGITEKTYLIQLGLKSLIAAESSKRLANLGGKQRGLRAVRRRRI